MEAALQIPIFHMDHSCTSVLPIPTLFNMTGNINSSLIHHLVTILSHTLPFVSLYSFPPLKEFYVGEKDISYIKCDSLVVYRISAIVMRMLSPNSARQTTLPRGRFWRAKLTTSDDLGNFLTHVTTFHDLCMTLTIHDDNI